MQHPDKQTLSQLMDGEWQDLNPSDCVLGLCKDEALKNKWARYHLIRDVMKNEPVDVASSLASRICAAIADEPTYSNVTGFGTDADNNLPGRPGASRYQHHTAHSRKVSLSKAGAASGDTLQVSAPPVQRDAERVGRLQTARPVPLWRTGVTGFALAASVALVTVVGLNVWQGQTQGSLPSLASNSAVTPLTATITSTSAAADSVNSTSVAQARNLPVDNSAAVQGNNAFSQQIQGVPLPIVQFVANSSSYWVTPETARRVGSEERLNMFLSQHIENSPTSDREGMFPYSRLVGYDELRTER